MAAVLKGLKCTQYIVCLYKYNPLVSQADQSKLTAPSYTCAIALN